MRQWFRAEQQQHSHDLQTVILSSLEQRHCWEAQTYASAVPSTSLHKHTAQLSSGRRCAESMSCASEGKISACDQLLAQANCGIPSRSGKRPENTKPSCWVCLYHFSALIPESMFSRFPHAQQPYRHVKNNNLQCLTSISNPEFTEVSFTCDSSECSMGLMTCWDLTSRLEVQGEQCSGLSCWYSLQGGKTPLLQELWYITLKSSESLFVSQLLQWTGLQKRDEVHWNPNSWNVILEV